MMLEISVFMSSAVFCGAGLAALRLMPWEGAYLGCPAGIGCLATGCSASALKQLFKRLKPLSVDIARCFKLLKF